MEVAVVQGIRASSYFKPYSTTPPRMTWFK